MNKISIVCEDGPQRVDKFIASNTNKSRGEVQKYFTESTVLINGKVAKPSQSVKSGDLVEFETLEIVESTIEKQNIPLEIVYEDSDVIVVNKPSGMVVHPANGHYKDTLVNALLYSIKDLSSINGVVRPGIVHRIDKNTSGLLVVAKNDNAHIFLQEQLKDHSMHREYYALVEGVIPHTDIKIDAPIGKDPKDRLKRAIDIYEGKDAVTHVHVEERFKEHTLVSCRLETGRTHQIRVHLRYINHPIVGDPEYGKRHQKFSCSGQMLHAYRLTFIHPTTKKEMTFTCPRDSEFESVLEQAKNLK